MYVSTPRSFYKISGLFISILGQDVYLCKEDKSDK